MPERKPLRPSAALAAYAEPLLDGRRAIVFGDSSSALADQLLERGARLVHLYDPDPTRVAEAATRNTSRNVTYGPLGEGGLAVREGAFDVGLVDDLSAHPDVAQLLQRLRRCLSSRGIALVCSPNPDLASRPAAKATEPSGPNYYELFDAVSASFSEVRMLGQTPFGGHAVVDFSAEGEPALSVDTGFVPGGAEEPTHFIAMASAQAVALDPFAIIQLPTRVAPLGEGQVSVEVLREAVECEKVAREQVAKLEARLAEERAGRATHRKRDTQPVVEKLTAEVEQRDIWLDQLKAKAASADTRAQELQAELTRERETRIRSEEKRDLLQRDHDSLARVVQNHEAQQASAAQKHKQLENQLSRLREEKKMSEPKNTREKTSTGRQGADRPAGDPRGDQVEASGSGRTAAELEDLTRDLTLAKRERDDAESERDALRGELAEVRDELARVERDGPRREKGGKRREPTDASLSADIAQLEARLRERGAHIRKLERDLKTAERVGSELLRQLKHSPKSGDDSRVDELRALLDQQARREAEREADLEAAKWSIQELEGRLSSSSS